MQKNRILRSLTAGAAFLASAMFMLPISVFVTAAQKTVAVPSPGSIITPKLTLTVDAPVVRTLSQMEEDGLHRSAPQLTGPAPFRPTVGIQSYLAAKSKAAQAPEVSKESLRSEGESALAPTKALLSIAGASQATSGGLFPPDTHGAVGIKDFIEVTNSHVDIFSTTGVLKKSISMAAFTGYFTQTLFDPRVVYDRAFDRWIVTAEAFPESSTVQRFFIAVSTGSDPLAPFCIYNLNVTFFAGDFFDFPQLGLDANAIVITANIFPAASADMFAIPKSALYFCGGFSVPVFTNLQATLAPPVVLDSNPKTFLIAAPLSGSTLKLYTLMGSGVMPTLTGPINIAVPGYTVPPQAPQPAPCTGATNTIDTSDSRFSNASTQNGSSLWQVHTVAIGPFATPRFYEINTVSNTVVQSGFFFATGSSQDFNASIVANPSNDVFVTWSSTDPPFGVNAQVRFSGRRSFESPGVIPAGSPLFTSSTCMKGNFDPNFGNQRWGDYSAVTIDPFNSLQAWIVNERISTSTAWGSQAGKITF